MDLTIDDNETQIIDAARDYLSGALPVARLHKAPRDEFGLTLRQQLAGLGWFAMGVPEAFGGLGFTPVEEMLLYREIGRHLAPTGIVQIATAAKIAVAAEDHALAERLVSGEIRVALALPVDGITAHDGVIDGKFRLFDPAQAEVAVILQGKSSMIVDVRDAVVEVAPCLDKSVSMGFSMLDGAAIVARSKDMEISRSRSLLLSAQLTGIAEAVLAMIVDYAKIRETFGRPIGAYQAVRHPAADMAVRAEVARCQLFCAAIAMRDGAADAQAQVDAAQIVATDAALRNVDWNIQLHGGIGVTGEHDAHFFLKRAQLLARWSGQKTALDRLIPALAEEE